MQLGKQNENIPERRMEGVIHNTSLALTYDVYPDRWVDMSPDGHLGCPVMTSHESQVTGHTTEVTLTHTLSLVYVILFFVCFSIQSQNSLN
jgi:hypothetical protein